MSAPLPGVELVRWAIDRLSGAARAHLAWVLERDLLAWALLADPNETSSAQLAVDVMSELGAIVAGATGARLESMIGELPDEARAAVAQVVAGARALFRDAGEVRVALYGALASRIVVRNQNLDARADELFAEIEADAAAALAAEAAARIEIRALLDEWERARALEGDDVA